MAKKISAAMIKNAVLDIRDHWKSPAEGKYISYKEFAAYSFGGIGVNTINSIFGYVALSANCLILHQLFLDHIELMSHFFLSRTTDHLLSFSDTDWIQSFTDQFIGHLGFKTKGRNAHFINGLAVNFSAGQATVIHITYHCGNNFVRFAE